jgi:hypothetical protein
MKYLALLVALAIVLLLFMRRAAPSRVDEALIESGHAAEPGEAAARSRLREPMDRTRAVLDQVKERNQDAEF